MTESDKQLCENDLSQIVFNISDVAKIVGVVPATIRNWEKAGLIESKRKNNNYRAYDFIDIEHLKKIKEYSSEKNMSIPMIKQLLSKDLIVHSSENKKFNKELYLTRLKEYRENEGYTLEDVSNAIGISPSYLSRIENGKAGVSYEMLEKLASYFGESTIRFFDIKNVETQELVKDGNGKELITGIEGVRIQSLINSDNTFESVKFIINPGCGDFKSHCHHNGEEFIYVLKGRLKVILDDSIEFNLKNGDSIHFKSTRLHKWHNPSNKISELLWVHSYL